MTEEADPDDVARFQTSRLTPSSVVRELFFIWLGVVVGRLSDEAGWVVLIPIGASILAIYLYQTLARQALDRSQAFTDAAFRALGWLIVAAIAGVSLVKPVVTSALVIVMVGAVLVSVALTAIFAKVQVRRGRTDWTQALGLVVGATSVGVAVVCAAATLQSVAQGEIRWSYFWAAVLACAAGFGLLIDDLVTAVRSIGFGCAIWLSTQALEASTTWVSLAFIGATAVMVLTSLRGWVAPRTTDILALLIISGVVASLAGALLWTGIDVPLDQSPEPALMVAVVAGMTAALGVMRAAWPRRGAPMTTSLLMLIGGSVAILYLVVAYAESIHIGAHVKALLDGDQSAWNSELVVDPTSIFGGPYELSISPFSFAAQLACTGVAALVLLGYATGTLLNDARTMRAVTWSSALAFGALTACCVYLKLAFADTIAADDFPLLALTALATWSFFSFVFWTDLQEGQVAGEREPSSS